MLIEVADHALSGAFEPTGTAAFAEPRAGEEEVVAVDEDAEGWVMGLGLRGAHKRLAFAEDEFAKVGEEIGCLADFGFLAFRFLRDFAFDGEGAGVADFEEGAEVGLHIDLSFAEGHFAAPGDAWLIAPGGIFAMHAADVAADLAECGDGFTGTVEDHIGRIEVDEEVGRGHIFEKLEEGVGGFLSGFEVKGLFVAGDVFAEVAGDFDDLGVALRGGIVGDEAEVEGDDIAAEEASEIGDLFHFLEAGSARFFGHEAHRAFDRWDIGVAFTGEAAEDASEFDIEIIEFLAEQVGGFGGAGFAVGGMELDGRDIELVRHLEVHTEPGIDACEDSDGPFGRGSHSDSLKSTSRWKGRDSKRAGRIRKLPP